MVVVLTAKGSSVYRRRSLDLGSHVLSLMLVEAYLWPLINPQQGDLKLSGPPSGQGTGRPMKEAHTSGISQNKLLMVRWPQGCRRRGDGRGTKNDLKTIALRWS
ncbi:hypothetical protein PoB_006905900 [Plakobranchus ocellatus]|uniref:Uncharacterized protein n=1 Tax=Plakobranchus ocellatus TaxID=259542 RepID=A0AAV4DEM2_9GAST|nr:hypothetical protein PoB_006905900 [Plakobranchus ocellatus]